MVPITICCTGGGVIFVVYIVEHRGASRFDVQLVSVVVSHDVHIGGVGNGRHCNCKADIVIGRSAHLHFCKLNPTISITDPTIGDTDPTFQSPITLSHYL